MARSPHIPAVLCLGALLALSGCDSPTAPDEATLEPAGPAFLIGDAPLSILVDISMPAIEVTTEVTRGLTLPKPNDVFLLRTSLSFTPGSVGHVDPKDDPVAQQKDDGLRGSGTVSIVVCINIPDDVWIKLVAADAQDGAGNPSVTATVELILVDEAGKEHVLDTKTGTGDVDANGDG